MSSIPSYPGSLEITPLSKPPSATVRVPGSKSITNRALVLAALTSNGMICSLYRALHSEDTVIMGRALQALGFEVRADWRHGVVSIGREEEHDRIPADAADIFVGNSGTTMRFLTAM